MKTFLRTLLASIAVVACVPAWAAEAIAFITNLKGEVAVDGAHRPLLMSELAKGQTISLGKESQLAVMYIQSGKEYLLKTPGDYAVGEREITAGSGVPPAARETPWRAKSEVLVRVAQTSSASIRMRSIAPVKRAAKPALEFPAQGAVATLQPTLRWTGTPDTPLEIALYVVGGDEKPLVKVAAKGTSHRLAVKLKPDTQYAWTLSAAGKEIGSARFRTLPAGVIREAEKRRPSEKAEFSDRLLYALLLQELGANEEAREAWATLAQERSDLPELAALAK